MKSKKLNLVQVCKQFEDVLAPRLRLSVIDRAVYWHLLRHSRLEGKRRLRFAILAVARHIQLSHGPVREAVRRLVAHGALRLIERSKAGHLVEVRLPDEIRVARIGKMGGKGAARLGRAVSLEEMDFLKTAALRRLIHMREGSQCFYCIRRTTGRMKCLDHVVPRAQFGRNSYRNLASCCLECNAAKQDRPAGDFLRSLYREGRLTNAELTTRLRALRALAAGKLRPVPSSV